MKRWETEGWDTEIGRVWQENCRDKTEQWWAERDGRVKQLCVTWAGWRGWGNGWRVQQGGCLLLMWGTQMRDNINRGYRKLLAGWATVHRRHDKCRWSKDICMLSVCKYGVVQKGHTIIQQLIRANLSPARQLITGYHYSIVVWPPRKFENLQLLFI